MSAELPNRKLCSGGNPGVRGGGVIEAGAQSETRELAMQVFTSADAAALTF